MRIRNFSLAALGTVLLGLPLAPVNGQDLSRLGGKRDQVPFSTVCSDARSAGSRGAVALQHPALAAQFRGAATVDAAAHVVSSASADTVVRPGETLYAFGRRNNAQIHALIEANRLEPPYALRPGQQLIVPHPGVHIIRPGETIYSPRVHTVQPGETIYSIARQSGVDLSALVRANDIQPPYRIAVGQVLILSDRAVTGPTSTPLASAGGIERAERPRPSAAAIVSTIVSATTAPAMSGRVVTAPASTPLASAGESQRGERPWPSAAAIVSAIVRPSAALAARSAAPPARMVAMPASFSIRRVDVVPLPSPVSRMPPLATASADAARPSTRLTSAVGAAATPIVAAPPPPPTPAASSAAVPPVPTPPPLWREANEPLKGTNAPAGPPPEAKIAALLSPSAGARWAADSAARGGGSLWPIPTPPPSSREAAEPLKGTNVPAGPPPEAKIAAFLSPSAVGAAATPIVAAPPPPPAPPASSAAVAPVPTPPPEAKIAAFLPPPTSSREADEPLKATNAPAGPPPEAKIAAFLPPPTSSREADEPLKGTNAPAGPPPEAKIAAFLSPSAGARGAADSGARGGGFLWPIRGKIVSGYGAKESGQFNDGINIAAALGQTVIAADDGVVVYSGNEIRGYGNLLLIKHAKNWITAYGHNDVLLVARGEHVHRGQPIAKAGRTGDVLSPQLHFEIRHGSRAVDPLKLVAHG